MVPVEVVPSPQLMVALNALVGSTPLAWVKVATWKLVSVRVFVRIGAETTMGGSENIVVALPLLLAEFGSGLVPVTEATSLVLPSSIAWAVTVAVTVPLAAMLPIEKVTTPPDWLNVPWPVVAD